MIEVDSSWQLSNGFGVNKLPANIKNILAGLRKT